MASQPVSSPSRAGLKTWSALAHARRRPSEYEVVTYKLHYRTRNPAAAYELDPDTPMNQWYRKHVAGSALQHPDWDAFRDPDQITYRAYTAMQDGQEQFVDELLSQYDDNDHDLGLAPAWVETLARVYTPGRYLMATCQMAAAYVVQMAPASTITNCAAFQEADSLRWLSRIAYRTRELANHHPDRGFARGEREQWEQADAWQGFRELMEKVLATYDWGENFVALNLVATRAIDEAFVRQLGRAARAAGDTLTATLADNQFKDYQRSRRWTTALVGLALQQDDNRAVIQGWLDRWVPLGDAAIRRFCGALPDGGAAADAAIAGAARFRQELGFIG